MTEPTHRGTGAVAGAATSAEALAIASIVLATVALLDASPIFWIVGDAPALEAKHFVGSLIIGLSAIGLGLAAVGKSAVPWIRGAAGAAALLSAITVVLTFIAWVASP